MRNPREYCPRCDRRFGITEEECSGCGFNPIEADEEEYDAAITAYDKGLDHPGLRKSARD